MRAAPRRGALLRSSLVVGGLALVCALVTAASVQAQEGEVTAARIDGVDRFDTAASISADTFHSASVVHVVTGRDFADALAGSFAAGAVNGPLLLVTRDAVPQRTGQELDRLDPEQVVVVGGDAAVSEEVEAEIAARGYATDRIFGADRYETAAAVAERYGPEIGIGMLDGNRTALLASGQDFPDALAAGPLSARLHMPLLLTPGSRTDASVEAALADLDVERLVIVGGEGVVTPAVAAHHDQAGYTVERWSGADRTATAAQVADNATDRLGFTVGHVLLARGDDYPDALAASTAAGTLGAPILLSRTPQSLSGATRSWLSGACPDIDVVRAVGGTAAVSTSVLDEAVAAAQECHTDEEPIVEVSSFTTPLEPGQPRNTNIHRAADYVDGSVIEPGAGFSLNEAIGPRTRERGFVENGFIDEGGDVVSVVGGGVSQVATTFLNAAWFAGIHIEEFRQHTIYFERYPMCREATLAWDQLDVVVVNDSPAPLTVSASYTDSSVTFSLLGRPWAGVESWIGDPYDVEGPGGAFSVDCGRTITYPDGTQSSEEHSWRYHQGHP